MRELNTNQTIQTDNKYKKNTKPTRNKFLLPKEVVRQNGTKIYSSSSETQSDTSSEEELSFRLTYYLKNKI